MPRLERVDEGGLRAAVGAVHHDELVDAARAREVAEHAVDGVLHLLLARHAAVVAVAEGHVEDLEAAHLPGGVGHLLGAEGVDGVAQVLGGVARLGPGLAHEERDVFLEGEDGAVLDEVVGDLSAHLLQVPLRFHEFTPVCFGSTSTQHPGARDVQGSRLRCVAGSAVRVSSHHDGSVRHGRRVSARPLPCGRLWSRVRG